MLFYCIVECLLIRLNHQVCWWVLRAHGLFDQQIVWSIVIATYRVRWNQSDQLITVWWPREMLMIIRNFQQPYFYSKLLGAAQSVRDGRGNRRCNYACDYKHSRGKWEGMKSVSDSAHWAQATTLTFNWGRGLLGWGHTIMQMGIVLDYWCRCSKSQHRRADSRMELVPQGRVTVGLRLVACGH